MEMNNTIEIMNSLSKYEKKYTNELNTNPIEILRDINVSKGELNHIARLIGILYSRDKRLLKIKFSVTVSLFLVWCTVYEYKDGDMWSNIFRKLELAQSQKKVRFFGDIFLDILNGYDLMQIKEGEGKKYLSPILMHGYISNNYAYDLFSYLNKIYSIVLEEDTSETTIEDVWGDIFSEDVEFKNIQKNIEDLQDKREEILHKLEEYNDISDEMENISRMGVEKLEKEVAEIEELVNSNKKIINEINGRFNVNTSINKHIGCLNSSFYNLCVKMNGNVNQKNLIETSNLIDEINNIIENKNSKLENNKNRLSRENKGLDNKLAIKRQALISIKSRITELGQGVLDKGWSEIENCINLREKLETIELQIKKKQKYENIELDKNTTIKQILTASLYNLKMSNPEYFKNFIIKTIQMMGKYFLEGKVDNTHPLYEIFTEWAYREPEKKVSGVPGTYESSETKMIKKKRLVLQSMKKPFIRLDIGKLLFNIIIPEQIFTFRQNIDIKPRYSFIDKVGEGFYIDIDCIYQGKNLYIKEIEILLESTSYEYLLFQWYNLREVYNISLDEIMIFDEEGNLLNKNSVKNGYYYIVYGKCWSLNNAVVIGEHNISFNNYKITEVYLNETKITLHNREKNETYNIIATNCEPFKLDNYNHIEGIYSGNLSVVTGVMPELLINYTNIDSTSINLKIFVNDNCVYNRGVEYLVKETEDNKEESIKRINIYKLLKLRDTAYKINIVLSHINGDKVLDEKFYFLPKTQFKYIDRALSVKIAKGMMLSNVNCSQKGMEYIISLENKNRETFSIYYNEYGWINLWVEVPVLNVKIFDGEGKKYPKGSILYGSKKGNLKNIFVQWETNSKRVKSILLYDNYFYFETTLHMKNGNVKTNLEPYFDLLNNIEKAQLCYKAQDGDILIMEETMLEIYDKWEVDNIKVQQKEGTDEYIIGIEYDENFVFEGAKYLQILNDNNIIIEKVIKDQIYLYIKKIDLVSSKVKINILYYDEFESVFGKTKETIIAGTIDIELKSKISETNKILNRGILITGFEYKGEIHAIKNPINLMEIKVAGSKNFEGEEMYESNVLSNDIYQKAYFYIDIEKKILPFLVDSDGDGAQYDPKNGRIFWEIVEDKNIMAPLENIAYVVKEE